MDKCCCDIIGLISLESVGQFGLFSESIIRIFRVLLLYILVLFIILFNSSIFLFFSSSVFIVCSSDTFLCLFFCCLFINKASVLFCIGFCISSFIILLLLLISLIIFENLPLVKLGAFLIFKVFSPSKVPVSIKHTPSFKLLSINNKSEGNTPSFFTLTISPILNSPLLIFIQEPFIYVSTSFEFCSLSNFLLFKSSTASRISDTVNTKTKGAIAVAAPNGLIKGML